MTVVRRRTEPVPSERQLLVKIEFPIIASCYADIAKACAKYYPHAVLGEDGRIWSRPEGLKETSSDVPSPA